MTGRRGLTLVTALTVASLLLGGGALNALAEEHGKNGQHGEGGDRGNSKHQQHAGPAVVNQTTTFQGKHDDEDGDDHPAMHAPLVPAQVTVKHEDDNKNNNNVQRKHEDDDEDLVTSPVRVTANPRPDDDNKDNNKHEDGNNNHQDDNDNQGDD